MEKILSQINNAALKLLLPLTLEQTYKIIIKEARILLQGKYGSVFLAQKGHITRVFATSKHLYEVRPRSRGYAYQAYKSKNPVIVQISKVKDIHPQIKTNGIHSIAFIPMAYQNRNVGIITIHSSHNVEELKSQINALKLYGSMCSLAIYNAKLRQENLNALKVRDLFISLASHELKTPLTAMNGYVQLLQKKSSKYTNADQVLVNSLSRETGRLTVLIHDLLEINQIRSGNMTFDFQICDLVDLCHQATKSFSFTHSSHKVEINKSELSTKVIADSNKIVQVIVNILNNAAKFSPVNKNISICFAQPNTRFNRLEITDRGVGIPAHELPHIFKDFYKGRNKISEGMGLGLFLAQKIVDAHNGVISVSSVVGQGTTFKIDLPKAN